MRIGGNNDEVYKNRKLKQEIEMLKDTIQEMEKSRSKNNIDLQRIICYNI